MRWWNKHSGFTLVEIVIVVLVLGILAAVAIPVVVSNARETQITALMNQIVAVADAAEMHYATKNSWPGTLSLNSIPGDFDGILPNRAFLSVAGGATSSGTTTWIQWVYVDNASVEFASVFAYGINPEVAIALDQKFDDGINNQGTITVSISNAPGEQVATVQYQFTFTIK